MDGFVGVGYYRSVSAAAVAVAAAAAGKVNGDLKRHLQVNSAWILILKQLSLGGSTMDSD